MVLKNMKDFSCFTSKCIPEESEIHFTFDIWSKNRPIYVLENFSGITWEASLRVYQQTNLTVCFSKISRAVAYSMEKMSLCIFYSIKHRQNP